MLIWRATVSIRNNEGNEDTRINRKESHDKADRVIYRENDYIESIVSLFVSGGECIDDIERLREDRGLRKLGLSAPSSESVRFYLYSFHDEGLLNKGRPQKGAFVPDGTTQLKELMRVNKGFVLRATGRQSSTIATIDQDTTVICLYGLWTFSLHYQNNLVS